MGGIISHLSSEQLLNHTRGTILDSTEDNNHTAQNFELQGSTISLSSFEGSSSATAPSLSGPPSLLRIKEEASGLNLDLNDVGESSSTSHTHLTKSGSSYSTQATLSEHVVIPTDPSFMQGM